MMVVGDTEENVLKLCQHAGLSDDDRAVIVNMMKLGVPVILEVCLSVLLSLSVCLSVCLCLGTCGVAVLV